MSTNEVRSSEAKAAGVDMKFEIVVIPVSDVDRAKEFYARIGWRLDADFDSGHDFRVMQFTPPGSGCSIIFGKNVTAAAPGSAQGLYLIVSDMEAARDELLRMALTSARCSTTPAACLPAQTSPTCLDGSGSAVRDPEHRSYRSFVSFSDPDGNGWLMQEVTTRLPGRVAGDTTYASAGDLSQAMQRAAAAHGKHEARTGQADANWPAWYAEYMVREQAGEELPT